MESTRPNPNYRLLLIGLWLLLYASFTLFTPPLLDDSDSVHAEVAREILLRNDWVTLYANGIRYLEKAPILYWSMAASFRIFGVRTFAARIPIALTVLTLVWILEGFARRAFRSARASLYAGLIALSSFGIFIFTRITIPDADVCLWLTFALYAYWLAEQQPDRVAPRSLPCLFAAACALNVLTKGLIGIVFPIATVLVHLLITRGLRGALHRLRQLHPFTGTLVFLAIAAPWHILIALANPTQGHPGSLSFQHGHWQVPLPTDGNVHGWTWFYFVNEHLLRYLNLRVPRDYDTVPLSLFWGLLLLWIAPWSAYLLQAIRQVPAWKVAIRSPLTARESTYLLLGLWAGIPLLFFSLSTRQEYYVLPAIPALALLIAAWLDQEATEAETFAVPNPKVTAGQRVSVVLLAVGSIAALAAGFIAIHSAPPAPNTDLATLLQQNPTDYALSFGHFLDLNAQAMGAFRQPLIMTAVALFIGTLANWFARRNYKPHAGNLWLAAATIVFLLAAHIGLQTFAPVLSSKELADSLAKVLKPAGSRFPDLIVIHGEYEAASTLGFYLHRPDTATNNADTAIHIYQGRSSNLWYGSFFPDAPAIFEDEASLALKWSGTRRVFLWQNRSQPLPSLLGKSYLIAQSGGKEILSNQPNPF
ncbi:MAG: glycosyl transferase family 39 [Acidobacteriaceae bacterium]|nr:glycosyl transferase family 39 [Acidobacteriaceae bacterium]